MLRADAPSFVPSATTIVVASTADPTNNKDSVHGRRGVVKNSSHKTQQRQEQHQQVERRQRQRRRLPTRKQNDIHTEAVNPPSQTIHNDGNDGFEIHEKSKASRRRDESFNRHDNAKARNRRRPARENKTQNHPGRSAVENCYQHLEEEIESSQLDEAFPALTTIYPLQQEGLAKSGHQKFEASDDSTTCWSSIAARLQQNEVESILQSSSEDDSQSVDAFGKLTLLKSTARKPNGQQRYESPNIDVDTDSAGPLDGSTKANFLNACFVEENDLQVQRSYAKMRLSARTTNSNMDKLRDRWWDILYQKMSRDVAAEAEKRKLDLLQNEDLERQVTVTTQVTSSSLVPTECSTVDDNDGDGFASSEVQDELRHSILNAYANTQHPLHVAIVKGDEQALLTLLSQWKDKENEVSLATRRQLLLPEKDRVSVKNFSPLHLAVYLDKPQFVSILLQSVKPSLSVLTVDGANMVTPLMLGSELGRDGCLAILLSHGALVAARDGQGNNALHYCCRAGAPVSTMKTLLGSRHRVGNSQLYKVLASRNEKTLQTPLHLACNRGHNHLVEALLNFLPRSTVARLLALPDHTRKTPLLAAIHAGRTNVVMSLLMWSGNRTACGDLGPFSYSKARWSSQNEESTGIASSTVTAQCPLVAAVQSENTDMVQILLEFHDSSDSVYNLTDALHEALRLSSDDCKLEMIQILVEAGASAFRAVTQSNATSTPNNCNGVTALLLATTLGNVNIVAALLDGAIRQLEVKRRNRRQDHRLQKQPESFFSTIEEKEYSEMDLAMSEALVHSLFSAWEAGDVSSTWFSLSMLLLRRNARVDMNWLRRCFLEKAVVPISEVVAVGTKEVYAASYRHNAGPTASIGAYEFNRSTMSYWSRLLFSMPWMDTSDSTQCSWFKMMVACETGGFDESFDRSTNCILLVTAEQSFLVHETIVSRKSEKLAAAIHFAATTQKENDRPIELRLGISAKLCQWLLQHIYHGSILSGLAFSNAQQGCQDMLDLMLIAEEFLCPTLMQECVMRLLSSDSAQCFCWNCCKSVQAVVGGTKMVEAECLFVIQGPSRLISVETAVDCLAVSQQLSHVGLHCNAIKFWRDHAERDVMGRYMSCDVAWKNYQQNPNEVSTPMALVGDVAAAFLLKFFAFVLEPKRDSVRDQIVDDVPLEWIDQHSRNATLLAVCLDEIALSPLGRTMSQNRQRASHGPKAKD